MHIDQQISHNLRRIRKAKGLTLEKTSELTGVSKAMLSQIERGVSSPTVARLWQIANGLDVSFSSFISNESSPVENLNNATVSAIHSLENWVNDDLYVNVIFPFEASVGFEVYELGLKENYEHKSDPHNIGVIEHVICISGKMAVYCDGTWHVLGNGQAIRFSGAQTHSYKNIGNGHAVFHDIIYYPQNHN
ncbi:helix-turn-helix domain-containing protein [Celerinatantimonas sp. YJH-8]|uniref:helix-turn-helix domain-containing protein n=1 Tax=Celerinatantimonas sp. YJH-8 TaxID=3228714 RepID=UPI0038C3058D